MSHPNHQHRRIRTFRVEVLESRALLSRAGLVSRPATPVAPLAQIMQRSGFPEVTYSYEGTFTGSFRYEGLRLIFSTSGPLSGKPSGAPFWVFSKGPEYYPLLTGNTESNLEKSKVTFKDGRGALATYDDADKISVDFKGVEHKDTFKLDGKVVGGKGFFPKAKGTFSAGGSLDRFNSTFTINFKIVLTKL
jgi:hypothetical protein